MIQINLLYFLVEEITTRKPTPPNKIIGCPIKMIPNEQRLEREHLVIRKVKCSEHKDLVEEHCLPKTSHVRYECRKGYRFENNKSKLYQQINFENICF